MSDAREPLRRLLARAARRCALAVLALALAVMVGWWTREITLVQVFPTLVPMQFNTALGLALGALAALRWSRHLTLAAALLCLLLGALSFAQYVGAYEFGIDTLLLDPWTVERTSHPGRMSPSTAVGLILAGCSALLARNARHSLLAAILAAMLLAIGTTALLGYLFKVEGSYSWGQLTDMALHTAVGCIALGAALFFGAFSVTTADMSWRRREAIVAGAICSLIVVGQSLGLANMAQGEDRRLGELVKLEARLAFTQLEDDLLRSAHAMRRMARRSSARGLTPADEWLDDAQSYVDDDPTLLGVVHWKDGAIASAAPADSSNSTSNRVEELRAEPSAVQRHVLIDAAQLLQVGTNLAIVSPAGPLGPETTAYLGLLDVQQLVRRAASRLHRGLHLSVELSPSVSIDGPERDTELASASWEHAITAGAALREWRVVVRPTTFWLMTHRSRASEQLLLLGLLLGVLAAVLAYKWLEVVEAKRRAVEMTTQLEREVGEHRKARSTLAARNAQIVDADRRLDLALNAGGIGTWDWDMRSGDLRCDELTARIFDAPVEQIQAAVHGGSLPMPAETVETLAAAAASCRAGVLPAALDLRVLTGSHTPRDITARGEILYDSAGKPRRVVGVVVDITDRRRIENELQSRNTDLEEFAYAASHDLQEPLRMVASFCELLEANYAASLDANGRKYLGFAVEGARRMQRLISDLLVLGSTGKSSSEPTRIDTGVVCRTVLSTLAEPIAEARAEITIGDLPPLVGHASEIERLFQNLISNALKYAAGDALRINISGELLDGELRFRVADNGPGIDPRFHERIFGAFKRVGPRQGTSTGIGLSLCRKIVEQGGGRLWVESELGAGAAFCFTWRREDASAKSDRPPVALASERPSAS